MSQQWPPQPPDQGQPGNPYGNPNPYGQYGPPSQYGQPGQPGQSGPPSQGFPPPGGGYPSYPTYPSYPGQQPGQPGTWGPPSQFGAGQYPPGYPQMGYGTPPPPKKSAGWIVPVIIGVILVVALGGAGTVFALSRGGTPKVSGTPTATTAPTATATPAVPSGFTTYTDSQANYRFFAPTTWSTTPKSDYVQFESDSDEALVEVGYEQSATGTLQQDIDSFFTSVTASGGGTIANRTGTTSATLGGETGSESTGDWTTSGVAFHVEVIAANHGAGRGLFIALAPSGTYASLDSQYFQTMLQSFTFLK